MSPILTGVIASGISGNLTPPWSPQGGYDALSTVTVPAGGVATVTFTGIPQEYKHLQLRTFVQQASTGGYVEILLGNGIFNRRHYITGSGANPPVSGSDTTNAPGVFSSAFSTINNGFAGSILDILDYTSSKNKVTRSIGGTDNNGSGGIYSMSSMYTSDAPVSSITLNAISQNFTENSKFALYGVK